MDNKSEVPKIFITVVAGFLGSHIADCFLQDNYEVVGCDNLIGGDMENVPKGVILLRLIPTASHNIKDIEETLSAFSKIRSKLYDGTYLKLSKKLKSN